jgi:hypothetical protein
VENIDLGFTNLFNSAVLTIWGRSVIPIVNGFDINAGSPFDYVAIAIPNGLTVELADETLTMSLEGGRAIIVPFCYAHIILNRIRGAKIVYGTRVGLDIFAVVMFPLSGGLSGGLQMLATADAIYAGIDIFMASDSYAHDVTGDHELSVATHQIWNNAGLVLGVANLTGLFIEGGGTLVSRFNLSKVLKTVQEIKRTPVTSVNALQQLKQKLQQQLNNLPVNAPNGISVEEYARFRNGLRAAVDEMDYNIKLFSDVVTPPTIHYTPANQVVGDAIDGDYKAFLVISNNMKPALGIIRTVDGVPNTLVTYPDSWLGLEVTPGAYLIGRMDDISFTDASGIVRRGDVNLYYNATNGKIGYRALRIWDDPLLSVNAQLVDLFNVYQAKGWI